MKSEGDLILGGNIYGYITEDNALKAVETARNLIHYLTIGPPLFHRTGGESSGFIDVPLMYNGFAVDRIHTDPESGRPFPKGIRPFGRFILGDDEIRERMEVMCRSLVPVKGAEFREPELAWAVPLTYGGFIVAHIKISAENGEIIPDYPLTEEVRRNVGRYPFGSP